VKTPDPCSHAQAWSTKQAAPTTSIELRANVCCVKYNPDTAHEIAVGSADHNVHLYDLRKSSAPVHVFNGEPSEFRSSSSQTLAEVSADLQAEISQHRRVPVRKGCDLQPLAEDYNSARCLQSFEYS
jgi:E3 ubiquitin-protein ligase RFWD2